MWKIGPGTKTPTVLTSFPINWSCCDCQPNAGLGDPLDVREKIMRNLARPAFAPRKKSVGPFAAFVAHQCSSNVLETSSTLELRYRFLDQYQISLNRLTAQKAESFQSFYNAAKTESNPGSLYLDDTFSDFRNFQEAEDISEEIEMLLKVRDDQLKALSALSKNGSIRFKALINALPELPGGRRAYMFRQRRKSMTKQMKKLLQRAREVVDDTRQILWLKQRHASSSEARSLRKLAEASERQVRESARQSDTTFVFTAISVVFLPLTTLASFFGMNAVEFGQVSRSWVPFSSTSSLYRLQ